PYRMAADYSRWRIEFGTAENFRAHQVPGFNNNSGETSRRRVEIVSLPAAGIFELSPRVVRPDNDRAQPEAIELDCFALNAEGKPGTRLFEKVKVALASNVGAASVVLPSAKADAKKEGPAPPKETVDVTNGLLFLLRPAAAASPSADTASPG